LVDICYHAGMDVSATKGSLLIRRIVSGGQTGVDRAALDVAIELGIEHGGWCPQRRKAEDGPIDRRYNLRQTRSAKYHVRTRLNVLDSDGTLILYRGELTGGTELTLNYALAHGRPCLAVDVGKVKLATVRRWLVAQAIETLNVAGPRESTAPGVYEEARSALRAVLCRPSTTRSSAAASTVSGQMNAELDPKTEKSILKQAGLEE
jgi:hypothetical protein